MGEESATQVNVKLPVSMKREWEDYVEQTEEATSLSHLIRLAVQREISDDTPQTEIDVSGEQVDLDVDIDGIERRIASMEETLTEVRDTVNALETGHLADEEQIEDIADRIYDTIPRVSKKRVEDGPELSARDIAKDLIEDAQIEFKERGRSIEDLAENQNWDYGLLDVYQEYFGINDYELQKAVGRVKEYSSRVHVIDSYEYDVIFEVE